MAESNPSSTILHPPSTEAFRLFQLRGPAELLSGVRSLHYHQAPKTAAAAGEKPIKLRDFWRCRYVRFFGVVVFGSYKKSFKKKQLLPKLIRYMTMRRYVIINMHFLTVLTRFFFNHRNLFPFVWLFLRWTSWGETSPEDGGAKNL